MGYSNQVGLRNAHSRKGIRVKFYRIFAIIGVSVRGLAMLIRWGGLECLHKRRGSTLFLCKYQLKMKINASCPSRWE